MYITPLKFKKVLDWFYHQQNYKFMFLFVSSFDYNDKNIVKEIVDNARRIQKSAFSTLLRKGMKSKLQILRQMILCIGL